jgi:hypothetical protein
VKESITIMGRYNQQGYAVYRINNYTHKVKLLIQKRKNELKDYGKGGIKRCCESDTINAFNALMISRKSMEVQYDKELFSEA